MGTVSAGAPASSARATTTSDRQHDLATCRVGVRQDRARRIGHPDLAQRGADIGSERVKEGVGHRAADRERIDPVEQVAEEIELGGDLGAADDRGEGPRRRFQSARQRFQFGLHRPPRGGGQKMSQPFRRSVRAVRGGKGVVDVDFPERGERPRESGIVRFLAGVETQVLEQQDLARAKPLSRSFGDGADAVLGERDLAAAERPAQGPDEGAQGQVVQALALRSAEMGKDNRRSALVADLPDGGREAVEPGRVGDGPLFHRNVEIGAQQHPLSGEREGTDRPRHRPRRVSRAGRAPLRRRSSGWRSPTRCRTS